MASRVRHICLVTDFPLALDGRVLNQAYTLSRAGYRVTIVDQSIPGRRDPLASVRGRLPAWVTESCSVLRLAESDGGPWVGMYTALQKPARPLARWLVSRAISRVGADLYQVRSIETLRSTVPAARRLGVKILYDVRDFVAPYLLKERFTHKRYRVVNAERRALPYVGGMITVCDSVARSVVRHYNVPPPTVILNGKRTATELQPANVPELRRELGMSSEQTLLAFSGMTRYGRGLEVIITAVARMPGVHLAFVGIADPGGALGRRARDAGAGERISFHPPVPAPEVPAYIRSADAAIACIEPLNPNHASALPNKVFEAVAAQLPLIASDLPEMRRVVEEYRLGAVFDPSDADALAQAIRTVLAGRDTFRRNTIAAGRYLSWESQEEKLRAVYRSLVGPP